MPASAESMIAVLGLAIVAIAVLIALSLALRALSIPVLLRSFEDRDETRR